MYTPVSESPLLWVQSRKEQSPFGYAVALKHTSAFGGGV